MHLQNCSLGPQVSSPCVIFKIFMHLEFKILHNLNYFVITVGKFVSEKISLRMNLLEKQFQKVNFPRKKLPWKKSFSGKKFPRKKSFSGIKFLWKKVSLEKSFPRKKFPWKKSFPEKKFPKEKVSLGKLFPGIYLTSSFF